MDIPKLPLAVSKDGLFIEDAEHEIVGRVHCAEYLVEAGNLHALLVKALDDEKSREKARKLLRR